MNVFLVIGPDDKAYGLFPTYDEAYSWAEIKWNGTPFSIYELLSR